jgi:glycolate oxidase iron-sulfur subunit
MKAHLEGRAAISASFERHIDSCLGCMACVTACPSGVRYDLLIEHTRPLFEEGRSVLDKAYRRLLFSLLPYPQRLRWLAGALRVAQRLGIQRAFRASGLARMLPARLAALERLAPPLDSSPRANLEPLPSTIAAAGPPRRRVGLLLGCVQRTFFPGVNHATARVLSAEGCEVVVPANQQCCGALMLHAGQIEEARDAARHLIDAFDDTGSLSPGDGGPRSNLVQIVINAAGCGSAMKEYGELLRDDPDYAGRAREFSRRCVDVSELLAELEPRAKRYPKRDPGRDPMPLRVAYHDACHLNHAQRVKQAPRRVLQTIPGLEIREIAESDVCCGSAGIYNLLEPEPAQALRDRKVAQVLQTECDVLVSSNPGCLLQIASGLEITRRPIPTMHLVELVDASIRNDWSALPRVTSPTAPPVLDPDSGPRAGRTRV